MPQHIPGYWFDEEKKKYFKIEKNHLAIQGSQHSRHSVEQLRKRIDKHKLSHDRAVKEQTQTIRRAGILSHDTVIGFKIFNEIGEKANTANIQENRASLHSKSLRLYDLNLRSQRLGCFAVDPTYGSLFAIENEPNVGGHKLAQYSAHGNNSHALQPPDFAEQPYSAVTSLTLSRHDMVVITTLACDDWRGSIRIGNSSWGSTNHGEIPRDMTAFIVFDLPRDESAWAAAANPVYPYFACGLTEKWGVLRRDSLSRASHSDIFQKVKSDVVSVDWLDGNVFAGGQRNGNILLHDLRSGGSTNRLKHPGFPGKLSCVDEHRLVACGHDDALCMYDLRMTRTDTVLRKRKKDTRLPNITATVPVIQYPYTNSGFNPSLTISTELGLLAATSEDAPVEIWSLNSGRKLDRVQFWTQGDPTPVQWDGSAQVSGEAVRLEFAKFGEDTRLYATYKGRCYMARDSLRHLG